MGWDAVSHWRTAVLHSWQVCLISPRADVWLWLTSTATVDQQVNWAFWAVSYSKWNIIKLIYCEFGMKEDNYFYNLSFRLLYLPVELLSYGFLYPVFVILSSNCRLMVKSFCILSRFYLGGPTSVRGFGMYSIGPQSEGKVHCDIDNRHHQVFCHKCLNTWERAVCKLWAVFLSRGLR